MSLIAELRVYLKIKPLLRQIGVLTAMPLSVSRFLQILALVAQVLNIAAPIAPPAAKPYVAAAIGIIQVILHDFAGKRDTEGNLLAPPATK